MKDYRFLFEKYVLGQHRPEWQIQKYLSKIHGRIAFDIGAYHGQYSKVFTKHFQEVFAFEPDPNAAQFLESLRIRNLHVYELALSDMEYSAAPLYRYDGLFCPGILDSFHLNMKTPQVDGDHQATSQIMVRVGTYDDFAADALVDLVKIDVEGAEFKVLAGMKKAFLNAKVRRVLVELHDADRAFELETFFRMKGFDLFWLDSSHLFARADF